MNCDDRTARSDAMWARSAASRAQFTADNAKMSAIYSSEEVKKLKIRIEELQKKI
ncbi:hypothetical protein [Xenorhabdus ishibashii]|uniref:Uncharacterized protein n=1 Tax=Xenorhabdus ishibashii TaxID=1034471 RepID=A0A2D0K7W7_9GAMM|nr:hypothetical protein [Xenorhabdus ishibashii]PHM59538.1 hypothetical protein Xish_03657 [Xenorhabdus ishibashii]